MKISNEMKIRALAHKLNEATKWSALSRFGNTLPAKLTILAPFIGYMIVYNDIFEQFFTWSGFETEIGEAETALKSLNVKRLHFFYFGLIFFGLASLIYALFAPRQVSHFKSVEAYVLGMEEVKTEALTTLSLDNVLNSYMHHSRGETSSPFFMGAALSFPEKVQEPLFSTVNFLFENEVSHDDVSVDDEGAGRFYTGSGYIESEAVIDVIYSRRRVERGMWEGMLQLAFTHKSKDVFYLDFQASEYSGISVRIACALLFLFGVLLLLVPTILTSLLVLLS
jgi:hypothetical protein